jgi:hypothetical protein
MAGQRWRLGANQECKCLSAKQFLYIDEDCRACRIIPSDINIVDSLINFHSRADNESYGDNPSAFCLFLESLGLIALSMEIVVEFISFSIKAHTDLLPGTDDPYVVRPDDGGVAFSKP